MGQDLSGHQPELDLQPGTYRIISKLTGTNIQVSDHDHNKIVAWEKHDRRNQQWFVQASGAGYKFKNCQHGNYLCVASTDAHSLVYASRFPITWVLLKKDDGYLVQFPDNNRVLDLHFGWGNNGNEIHIWPAAGDNANKIWKFERISDESGEDLPAVFQHQADELSRELQAETKISAQKDEQIASLKRELEQKSREFDLMAERMDQKDRELAEKDTTIHQLQREKEEALSEVRKDAVEIARLQERQAELEDALSQQQAEVAGLQGKMDRVEYITSRMSRSYERT
ncbi:ricin-type beta-trefoil lectin domain protein [Ceratobasidium sp. AG-Ba]|nr:ricin-type beta-trefoil lectin domain protein [Ceratobasidium sp. AG-Ba]